MTPKEIRIEDFDYPLPDGRIARHPLAERDACKLLVACSNGPINETIFRTLPDLLPSNAVVVRNNTRVINARLRFHKSTGALIEIFCLEPENPADYAQNFSSVSQCSWVCFVGNSKKWKEGELTAEINIGDSTAILTATRGAQRGNAWEVQFKWTGNFTFSEIIEAAGEIPVPPYLNRATEETDKEDYQTVYSSIEGSVAAPTAGLHFTPDTLARIEEKGIENIDVTLHVGAGTFQPVKSDSIGQHPMHAEFIAVTRSSIEKIAAAKKGGKPVIAIGTTSVRTLESLYHIGCLIAENQWDGEVPQWYPYDQKHPRLSVERAMASLLGYLNENNADTLIASTRIIIAPGYEYKIVDGMITNFHQPRSTLLLLVSAFLGGERWREIYSYALSHDFRFLSYGDACFFKQDAF